MSSSNESNLNRRDLLKSAVAGTLALSAGGAAARGDEPTAPADPNLIRRENEKPGSTDWQLTRVRVNNHRAADIEGYCSKQSVKAGETIDIMVSTNPPQKFVIEIFRSGYYGGAGARLMKTLGPFPGKAQPVPEKGEKDLFECRWEPTVSLTIPEDWPSGVYLGRLTTLDDQSGFGYWQSYVIFIVKDDRPADILFQCSDNTWQAYNRWPSHYSVYTHPKGGQGPWADVSFDRPYGLYRSSFHGDPQSTGSGEWLCWEFPLAYWLEQQGYDVSYCSNTDMTSPDRALKCKSFISVGHDEYWDIEQYHSTVALRDAGVNLLFLSANTCCWVTPHRPSWDGRPDRIMFRGGPYGGEQEYAKIRERDHGPFPHHGPDEGYLLGARNAYPVIGSGDWVAEKPDHWMFAGTGMKKGESIPGLIGWEKHDDPATDIPGLEIVGKGTALAGGDPRPWTATIYPGPKENFVFNGSTIFWNLGLSSPPGLRLPWTAGCRPHGPDARVQRMTKNLLDRAIG